MGDAEIVQGVNCPIARWIHRGICMLASVSWVIMLARELFWPECSMLLPPNQKYGPVILVLFSAQFLIYAVLVVRSFYLPIPTSFFFIPTYFNPQGSGRLVLAGFLAFMTVSMCGVSTNRAVEGPIFAFSITSGFFSASLLEWPVKDVRVQHVVYTYFVLALIGYLGYQRPFWPAFLFIVALVIVNAFLFFGVLRRDLPEPPVMNLFSSRVKFN